jgi:hypothetical protein
MIAKGRGAILVAFVARDPDEVPDRVCVLRLHWAICLVFKLPSRRQYTAGR